ncbi:hypothetical protein PspLS_02472, partial [Pyricularia sp. CBS 133598]
QNGPRSARKFQLDPTFCYLATKPAYRALNIAAQPSPRQSRSLSRWEILTCCSPQTNPALCLVFFWAY